MEFHHVEVCFLCDGKGALQVDQYDENGIHDTPECPCCHGTGELKVYGGVRPNN